MLAEACGEAASIRRGAWMEFSRLSTERRLGSGPLPARAQARSAEHGPWEGRAARRRAAPSTARGWASISSYHSDSDSRDPEALKRAEGLFQQGIRLYSDKKWAEAEAVFREAWALNPTFDVAYNLGSAEHRVGKFAEAAEHLAFALRHWPLIGATTGLRGTAEQRLKEAREKVGALRVTVSVAGAEVFVDGRSVGVTPLEGEVFVAPGEHGIEARREGYETARKEISATAGAAVEVELAPAVKPEVAPGPVGAPVTAMGPVGAARSEAQPVPPPAERSLVPAIALGGVAVVGLGVGIGLLAAAGGEASTAEEQHASILRAGRSCVGGAGNYDAQCPELDDVSDRADTLHNAGVGMLIGAGVAAAAAGAYLIWWPAPAGSASARVRAAPAMSATGGGVVVVGGF